MDNDAQNMGVPWREEKNIHCFSHKAMATIFEIFLNSEDSHGAQSVAHEAFKLLDQLENDLSRFIDNSDISRINKLRIGDETLISPDTFECLQLSDEMFQLTEGAFDITTGVLIEQWRRMGSYLSPEVKNGISNANAFGRNHFELDNDRYAVKKISDFDIELDLGGIGKGYAIDKLAELLLEWEFGTAFIHGGRSSLYALGTPTFESRRWPVTLSTPGVAGEPIGKLFLNNDSISGSGLGKGEHIIDPRTIQSVDGPKAAWAKAPSAAASDALSTAFMVLEEESIRGICRVQREVGAFILSGEKWGKN